MYRRYSLTVLLVGLAAAAALRPSLAQRAALPRPFAQARAAGANPTWFDPKGRPVTQGNEVIPLVDGPATFQSMAAAIGTARPRLTILGQFAGQIHNLDPSGPIGEGPDGSIYGTAPADKDAPSGSVYKVTLDGQKTTLFRFDNDHGGFPHGVTVARDGTLYGICSSGGKYGMGTVWRMAPQDSAPTVLWDFRNGRIVPPLAPGQQPTQQQILDAAGAYPAVPPVLGQDGSLYGVTPGADNLLSGVVYRIGTGGDYHGLYQFNRRDAPTVGAIPTSILQGTDGSLYGTTAKGGEGHGTVFRMAAGGGTPTCLHTFDYQHGDGPDSLMQASDGDLYGTCGAGGPGVNPGNGLVFQVSPGGQYVILHYFDEKTGSHPVGGVVEGKDKELYGVAAGFGPGGRGVVYRIARSGEPLQVMHAFGFLDAEGRNPAATPLFHSNGRLYGTTTSYGDNGGGTLWSLDLTTPDFVYLLNWSFNPYFHLWGPAAPTMAHLLATASYHDVQVRAMLWKQPSTVNNGPVAATNALFRGAAILDDRTLNFGSHHQKLLFVNGSRGLIAFCGGVDINPDRIAVASGQGGIPVHDVDCQVRGPAAQDLLNIFLDRWADHPDHTDLDETKGPLVAEKSAGAPVEGGTCMVQVGRTYGNAQAHAGVDGTVMAGNGYAFAPQGEQSAARMILRAIDRAQKFIYVEDQYFVDTSDSVALSVREHLKAKLADPNFKQLTILIPHGSITDMGVLYSATLPLVGEVHHAVLDNEVNYRRQLLIAALKQAGALPGGGNKVRVFYLKDPGQPHTYVHAKTWIFDDQYAIIGSANVSRRSWTHDSEVVVGIYDTGSQGGSGYPLPKSLRMRLWAEHLGLGTGTGWLPAPGYEKQLSDPLAQPDPWLHLSPSARVAPYDENQGIEPHTASGPGWLWWNTEWDQFVDPDGS